MNKCKRKLKKRSFKKVYLVIVDGYTEKWYFEKLIEFEKENIIKINIKPELIIKGNLKKKYEMIKENSNIYDKVFWILDFDEIIHNNKVKEFEKYNKKIKKIKNVSILINNPCFEFWLLLHFKNTTKYYEKCNFVLNEIKKISILKDYAKSEKYYKNEKENIYKKLK